MQAEYATDIIFRHQAALQRFYTIYSLPPLAAMLYAVH